MKRGQIVIAMICMVAVISFAFIGLDDSEVREMKDVKELVLTAYVNGAFNGLDADAMRKGFHEDFAIYSPKGEEISKYPIKVWADGVEKRKANGYDPRDTKNKWKHHFANIDITGHAATVKIELHNQGKHVYTDYLSLLKFDSGWRIVAKVYQKH